MQLFAVPCDGETRVRAHLRAPMSRFRDKRLRRLYLRNDARGLPPHRIVRIQSILAALLSDIRGPGDLQRYPQWRPHRLKGDRQGF